MNEWLRDNWRVAAVVGVVALWLVQNYGPKIVAEVKAKLAALKPTIDNKTTILSGWPLIVLALVIGSAFVPQGKTEPESPKRAPDVWDVATATARALLADEAEAIAGQKFESTKDKEDALNLKIDDVIESSFAPVLERLGKAIDANQVTEFSKSLRNGELK